MKRPDDVCEVIEGVERVLREMCQLILRVARRK